MTYYRTSHVISLTERGGVSRHSDDKLTVLIRQVVRSAIEERDSVRGFEKLSENLEAYISGEREVAVACMVDSSR
jgi:hypothetical protein